MTQSGFLQQLFADLLAAHVRYAVMRNYETLPIDAGDSDLDLLVHPDDADRTVTILRGAAAAHGATVIGTAMVPGFTKLSLFAADAASGSWGLEIDVNRGLWYSGAQLLQHDFEAAVRALRGMRVLREDAAAVLGALKEVLNNAVLPARYSATASAAAKQNWGPLATLLAPMGSRAVAQLRALLSAAPGPCPDAARGLRRSLAWQALRVDRVKYLGRRCGGSLSRLQRYLHPSGAVVAILGVDGVGKSTVIDRIMPVLQQATHGGCTVKHLRPRLLPPLSRLKGRVSQEVADDPHGSKPAGWLGSMVRITWLASDYVLGYWLRVRPLVARKPGIALFDRYSYDMALDPRRFRLGIPSRLVGWCVRCLPRPDLAICLHADPAVIHARKQELPEAEIRRQVDGLRRFAATQSRAVLVSTDGTPDEVRDRVLAALQVFFARRDLAQHGGTLGS